MVRSPHLQSLIGSFHANEIQLHGFDWTWKVSVLLVEIQFQELIYKDCLTYQERSVGILSTLRQFSWRGRPLSAGFSLKLSLHERSLCRNDYQALFLYLTSVSHQETFLVAVFLRVDKMFRYRKLEGRSIICRLYFCVDLQFISHLYKHFKNDSGAIQWGKSIKIFLFA